MRLRLLHTSLIVSLCALLTACTDTDFTSSTNDDGKTPIELSVGGADSNPVSRAVVTDGTGKTLRAFSGTTRLFFALVAEDGSSTSNKKYGFNYGTAAAVSNPAVNSKSPITFSNNYLYWDDAYARDSKVSVYSIAVANKERGKVELTENGSIAIGTETPGKSIIPFTTTSPGEPIFKWQIGKSDGSSAFMQDQEIFEWADLVFSNNIANYNLDPENPEPTKDKRLRFHTDQNDGDKYHKFDQGELIYYHALTQFTIKIKCGDGFKGDGTDFKFTNAEGVACTTPNNSFGLNGFYGADGVFRIGNGEFDSMTELNKRNYTSIYKVKETHQKEDAGEYYILNAYVFPGTDMTGTKADAFSFVLDGNRYDISLAMLYDAIMKGSTNVAKQGSSPTKVDASILDEITVGEGGKKLKAGYNYEFTFTVGKSKIKNITAQVVDWETVVAQEVSPKNTYITLDLKNNEGTLLNDDTPVFDLYRSTATSSTINSQYQNWDWEKGYSDKATLSKKAGYENLYETEWYWPNNKTFYHLRTVNKGAQINTGTSINNDYVSIFSGKINDTYTNVTANISSSYNDGKYNDFKWGAPFKAKLNDQDYTITYSPESGFCNNATKAEGQLYYAIGPTESTINFTQFHVMSNIYVHLTTTESTNPDYIDLTTITSMKLFNFAKNAKLYVGNGRITEYGEYCTEGQEMTKHASHVDVTDTPGYEYSFRVVPQTVSEVNSNKKSIVITTSSGNLFTIEDLSQIKQNTTGGNFIDPWQPGKSYFYTFKLTKKGIEPLQVTEVDWKNVVAAPEDIQIQ